MLTGSNRCEERRPAARHLAAIPSASLREASSIISPYARTDYVSGTTADQTSILAFIEDNWLAARRIGGSSFGNLAGPLDDMFSWGHPRFAPYLLGPATGEPAH